MEHLQDPTKPQKIMYYTLHFYLFFKCCIEWPDGGLPPPEHEAIE
jgi:hypothetical protein